MAQSSSSSRRNNNGWIQFKEEGKKLFSQENYEGALTSYREALVIAPDQEKQILLSNIVACRLKIGGPAMAAAAVEDAKKCIALCETWAKGHVRLASAYIALGNHSNDACNALQRALSLDPSNSLARQMLLRELRRDPTMPEPTAPPAHYDDTQRDSRASGNVPTTRSSDLDDHMSIYETMAYYWDRSKSKILNYWTTSFTWYRAQPEDVQTLLKVLAALIVLYVMFGGRFGLAGWGSGTRGNYSFQDPYTPESHRYTSESNNHHHPPPNAYGTGPTGSSQYSRTTTSHDDGMGYQANHRHHSNTFQFPNLFDGSYHSMMILMGIVYLCHRNGINPFQAMMMMNMMNTVGRGGMGYGGMGGMGYGMGRNAGLFGGRPRPGYR